MTDETQPAEQSESQPEQPKTPYTVKNIKYVEKTVRGRVIGRNKTVIPEEQCRS